MSADGSGPAAIERLGRVLALLVCVGTLLLAAASATVAADPSAEPQGSPIPAPPAPTPIAHPAADGANSCADCHGRVNETGARITEAWAASVHGTGGVGCADCHGGDPTSDTMRLSMSPDAAFIGTPSRAQTVGVCGGCHSDVDRMRVYKLPTDQFAKYWSSVHGQRLAAANDTRVAICIDCHGSHDVRKASDPTAAVYPPNVPELCASCHADPDRMEPYGIPTDQFEIYRESVHGRALLGNLDVRAPSCASCHGSHDAKPPRSTEVVEVCGTCHTATQELYLQSRHAELEQVAPKCWTCHGTHDVSEPGIQLFLHEEGAEYTCVTCHDPARPGTLRIELERFEDPADRRCDTCHHPRSQIYAQVDGIREALSTAQASHDDAQRRIDEAARLGMMTDDAEMELSQSRTSLIQAQAAVHTTSLTAVAVHTDEAKARARSAGDIAQATLDESGFRRQAMIMVLAVILVNVGVLFAWKRRLDRRLDER